MIKDFQKKHGLVADGIVGKKTALKIKEVFDIETIEQLANFLGQMAHESSNFTRMRENMNYSSQRLSEVWPQHFAVDPKAKKKKPNELAKSLHLKAEAIANYVYADKNRTARYKLGNTEPGDGWKFRGNGPLQTTGRNNHRRLDKYLGGVGITENPDILWKEYYIEAAKFFFDDNKLWNLAKAVSLNNTRSLTKAIQGGSLHVNERHNSVLKFYNLIKK